MNRNSKSHFSATDNRINVGRSRFDRSSWWKGTMATGSLVPFYIDEVLPGDTFDMKTSVLCRMATPLFPVMDNAYLDTYFFFVPNRLVWDHWKEFNGENDLNAWVQTIDYQIPTFKLDPYNGSEDRGNNEFTLCDYFGLVTDDLLSDNDNPGAYTDMNVSILPLRAYQLIWNEWFRDQNLQDPILIDRGDFSIPDPNDDVAFDAYERTLKSMNTVRKANKFHDYFTSCLPAPQKGSAVRIPGFDASVPVVTGNSFYEVTGFPGLSMVKTTGVNGSNSQLRVTSSGQVLGYEDNANVSGLSSYTLRPNNLYVGSSDSVTIDALRFAFQLQKLLWRDGNGGSRYTEVIRSHFGVVSPDSRLQRPEYLGGKRIPITVNQVIQTSSTDEASPQGNTAAVSKTVDSFNGFTKSFTEHGFIIGVCCVRTDHTYQQGINRMWSRKDRFDFYWPEFAHIGEQAVLNKEIYAAASGGDEVFGYQEAWAEYRYRPSFVTGAFRSSYTGGSLDSWHYADDYEAMPRLSSEWIEETTQNVERSLAVQNRPEEQWLLDFYFDLKTTRPMPVYSVPGLVDHF